MGREKLVPPTSCNDECQERGTKGGGKRLLVNMTNHLRPHHRLQDGNSGSSRIIISCEAIARKLLTISSSCCILSLPLTVAAVTRYVSIMVVAIMNFRHGHVVAVVIVVAVDDIICPCVDLGTESTWAGA